MRVFLTGGTGLVGSHAAERLVERGHEVVALLRRGSDAAFLERLGVERVEGDVRDAEGRLAGLMVGCDAVVHAAAVLFRRGAERALYDAVNVGGTERVLRAAAAAGASRVLHVSSIAVYGDRGDRPRLSEEDWLASEIEPQNLYARSKRAAEQAAWRLHEAGAIRLTTVRPGMIYGERDRWFTRGIARLASLPVIVLPAGGHRALPLVYAGNVADGIVAALERDVAVGRAYNLGADRPLTARALLETFGRMLGRAPRVLSVPPGLLVPAAVVGDAALRILPGFGQPALRRFLRRLVRGDPYDTTRARRELAWSGRVPPDEALARTAAWYRSRAEHTDSRRPTG